jgi:D-alanine-D-alanine ligase
LPARIPDEASARAAEAAVTAHVALGLRHISRVDIIVDKVGTPWFLEANVLPGLTETSLLPQALEAAGHDLGWVYAALAEAAIAEARA